MVEISPAASGQSFGFAQALDLHRFDAAPGGLSYGIREGEMVFICSKEKWDGSDLVTEATEEPKP